MTNGVCHITFTGNVVMKLRFGLYACRLFAQLLGQENSYQYFEGTTANELGVAKILYFGYLNELQISEEKQIYSFEDFVNYVEGKLIDADVSEITEAINIFSETKTIKKLKENTDAALEELKKKQTINGMI